MCAETDSGFEGLYYRVKTNDSRGDLSGEKKWEKQENFLFERGEIIL